MSKNLDELEDQQGNEEDQVDPQEVEGEASGSG
jgi:hypothetical protein